MTSSAEGNCGQPYSLITSGRSPRLKSFSMAPGVKRAGLATPNPGQSWNGIRTATAVLSALWVSARGDGRRVLLRAGRSPS